MKKGQISMFVVIGLMLLLAAGLFFFINQEIRSEQPVVDVPDVSLETRPANQLIQICLESTAQLAITQVAAQGGYTSAPQPHPLPHRGSSILFTPHEVPFWRYLEETDCPYIFGCPASERPPLCKTSSADRCAGQTFGSQSIEDNLERFVLDNIDNCIANLTSISDFYDVSLSEERTLDIFFNDGSTTFVMVNPIEATSRSTENTQTIERYRAELDADVLGLYEAASELLEWIELTNYYEDQTMNMINVYTGTGENTLPPTDLFSFVGLGGNPIWVQQVVKEQVETEILPLMSLVHFQDYNNYRLLQRTSDYTDDYNHYIDGLYATFSPSIGDEVYPYDLTHSYLHLPIKFQIDEGKQIIKPKKLDSDALGPANDIIGIALKDMRFKYYMSYPLLLTMSDPDAFQGEGLDFNFAIEVNIANNRPAYRNKTIAIQQAPIGISLGDAEQRVDREITIEVLDAYTKLPLHDVTISYVCSIEYEIGNTRLDANGDAKLITQLPNCETGGYLKYSKFGYLAQAIEFNNPETGADVKLNIEMWPVKQREVIIRKRSVENLFNIVGAGTGGIEASFTEYSEMDEKETAMLTLEKEKVTAYEQDFPLPGFGSTSGSFNYEELLGGYGIDQQLDLIDENVAEGYITFAEGEELKETLTSIDYASLPTYELPAEPILMDFVPGTYELELTLFDYEGMFVPRYTEEFCPGIEVAGICPTGRETVVFEEVNVPTWVKGGANLNITITPETLYESDEPFIFYALEIPTPTNWKCFSNPFDPVACYDSLGFCGEPQTANYCVPFEGLPELDEFQQEKEYLVTDGTVQIE